MRTRGSLDQAGFERAYCDDTTRSAIRDIFYPEFSRLMFLGDDDGAVRVLSRDLAWPAVMLRHSWGPYDANGAPSLREEKIQFTLARSEVMLFDEPPIGIFSIELEPSPDATLVDLANLTFLARAFGANAAPKGAPDGEWSGTRIALKGEAPIDFAALISDRILGGIALRGDHVRVDEYSGSKFRIYSVVSVDAPVEAAERAGLLFELGTGSPLGAAAGGHPASPSRTYYASVIQKRVSAFENWDALALLDSFTAVGTKMLGDRERPNKGAFATWGLTYFRLYAFNLFLKYALHYYASRILDESAVGLRTRFETFLSRYDVGRVSFNFLPELLFDAIRESLALDDELARFRKRIATLSDRIREDQAARTNKLLGLVSGVGTLASSRSSLATVRAIEAHLGWPGAVFYSLASLLAALLAAGLGAYLFPSQRTRLLRRLRRRAERRQAR